MADIITVVKTAVNNFPQIYAFTHDIHVDFTDTLANEPNANFGISSTGDELVREDILGNQIRRHSFVLYAVKQSYLDYDRLVNSTFLLDLAYYLAFYPTDDAISVTINSKTVTGELQELSSANAMLFEIMDDDINSGCKYQIQIFAEYKLESGVL